MNRERLKNGLEKMGIAADAAALERFEAFHAILDEYNARMDLTAVLDEDERVDRHDLDSAAPLPHGLLAAGARVIDVGTGAGFPGMPLLILRPDLRMTFLDALKKRILFLQDALSRLGLQAEALHARAEDAARLPLYRGQYDAAVSRAVAAAPVLQELTLPFLRQGGLSIAWKGPGLSEEMTAARRAAFLLGGTVRGILDAPVPGREEWAHVLLITEKTGKTPDIYPRRAGTPGKKPLGRG
ncbi:MAG TPA: 16S rRNA (guanine(527)-N(7))-methyltransferase RsmG [Candidatus Ventricola intestinavium]|nr:16S rRNA (guanine(527)-N(7))-methyltransferase RsmG [Candidatus Ventricola intestinavium]